jgi:four helix bundle protein
LRDHCRFLEISYGSLKETKYLLYFSYREKYINNQEYEEIIKLSEEIGKMLWSKIQTLKNQKTN